MKPGDMFRTLGIKSLYKDIRLDSHLHLHPIGEIPWKTIGIILEIHRSWFKILLQTGTTGWCSKEYIKAL